MGTEILIIHTYTAHVPSLFKSVSIFYSLYKIFSQLDPEEINNNFHYRFDVSRVELLFPQLKVTYYRNTYIVWLTKVSF